MRLRIAQVIGMGFLFVPITLVSYSGLPPERNNAVAGMINFMRNIGASIGTSLVTTLLAQRSQFHQAMLSGHLTQGNPGLERATGALADGLARAGVDAHEAHMQAYAAIYRALRSQAAALAYVDTFWLLGVASMVMFALALLLKRNLQRRTGVGAFAH